MCVRKPVISLCWRKQKEGGYKGTSEGKECADRREDKLDMPAVLLIYACGALQDGSALVFVLLAHSKIDTVLCV